MTRTENQENASEISPLEDLIEVSQPVQSKQKISLSARADQEHRGQRFDLVAVLLFPDYSRSMLQSWIRSGDLLLSGKVVKPNVKLTGTESLELNVELQVEGEWEAEDIPLDVIFEDDAVIVINKPVSLVVHPASGNWTGTLLNGLLFRYPELQHVPRAGIVHRLDKDTSGLMVVARTIEAQNQLVKQLQARSVNRFYQAIAYGECGAGTVDQPMGRHPAQRTKMAVLEEGSSGAKEARTHYETLKSFEGFSFIELKLDTGRTHQIRVHMAHVGHPLVGDQVYGKKISEQEQKRNASLGNIASFPRQALHARRLGFMHPKSGDYCEWESELPEDFQNLLSHLNNAF